MDTNILGFNIYNKRKSQLIQDLKQYEKVHIISGNPEVLTRGLENPMLIDNFKSENSIIIPDGVGTIVCAKIVRSPVQEKIAGIEVMEEILKFCAEEGKSIYLLGAKKEIVEQCIQNLKKKYSELKIAGYHDGYFDINDCKPLLKEIEESEAYAIFIAMGCPRQEIFISQYMKQLPCKVFMGVGGSFDIFAGKLKRAPKWMIRLGLEWLYRVAKEPFRIVRLWSIPKFILRVFKNTYL